ncbi:MAG TPA: hypothetical protein VK776_19095, partial [Bryobacteraceae bacterium]|nr:hypothetical protein [Bryobacteraceae bacterium]
LRYQGHSYGITEAATPVQKQSRIARSEKEVKRLIWFRWRQSATSLTSRAFRRFAVLNRQLDGKPYAVNRESGERSSGSLIHRRSADEHFSLSLSFGWKEAARQ